MKVDIKMLGKAKGIFDIDQSDNNVGSLFSKKDLCKLFNIDKFNIEFLKFDKNNFIDEKQLHKNWHKGNFNHICKNRIKGIKIGFDELIIIYLLKKIFINIDIEQQYRCEKKYIDIKIKKDNDIKFIEFLGPSHFVPSYYNKCPLNPLERKKYIEDKTGYECILWPYWIQKCETNIKAIFDNKINGLGAIWSANVFFNYFVLDNSADIIDIISDRFRIIRNDSYGYMYENNSENRNKPEHPILNKIRKDISNLTYLIPKGHKNIDRWIPQEFIYSPK